MMDCACEAEMKLRVRGPLVVVEFVCAVAVRAVERRVERTDESFMLAGLSFFFKIDELCWGLI